MADNGNNNDVSDDRLGDDNSYRHNPSDFIDIHGGSKATPASSHDPNTFSHSPHSHSPNSTDSSLAKVKVDNEDVTQCSEDIAAIKLPIQETDGSSVTSTKETSYHFSPEKQKEEVEDESEEDAYESAEEGKDEEGDEDSNEEFVPVNEEERKACSDSIDKSTFFGNNEDKRSESDDGEKFNESEDEPERKSDEQKKAEEMEARKKVEELLSDEEKQDRKDKAQTFKNEGNTSFREGDYDSAITAYSEALSICPLEFHKERSIMFANRAACKMKQEFYEAAILDSTDALDLHPHYLKAMLRRAELFEKTEKLDEALKDYQKVVELDPGQHAARAKCIRLAEQIKDRNEKMKTEMLGKLKDLGDMVLRPFGLSTNNFNLQQDPNTGSYSVQFQQNASGNGK